MFLHEPNGPQTGTLLPRRSAVGNRASESFHRLRPCAWQNCQSLPYADQSPLSTGSRLRSRDFSSVHCRRIRVASDSPYHPSLVGNNEQCVNDKCLGTSVSSRADAAVFGIDAVTASQNRLLPRRHSKTN